jgi:hypothetical protein
MPLLTSLKRRLIGVAKTAGYKFFPINQFTQVRDLPPFNFDVIRAMLLDPTIRLGLAMRMAPLCQAEFAFKEGDEWVEGVRADNPEVGQFVHRQMKRIWRFDLHHLLKAQIWGWSAGEVMFRRVDDRIEYDKFLHRASHDVFAITENGDLRGTLFKRVAPHGQISLLFPKTIWHRFDNESESAYGVSVLKGAFSSWADKWLNGGALDVRRLFMHKDAYGGDTIGYPPGQTDIDGKGMVPNRDIARQMVEQSKAGSVITKPNAIDPATQKEMWTVERATVPANPVHILQFPKDLDVEMLRGIEIPDDVVTSEASGAWQGKQVPMQAFFCNSERWLSQVIRDVVQQNIEHLVMLNFGRAEEFEVTTKPLAEQALEQIKGDSQAPANPPDAGQSVAMPAIIPGQMRPTAQPQQNGNGPRRFAAGDETAAELLVGAGSVQAAHLLEAGQRFLRSQTNGHT